jgi:hypothetical protein
VYLDPMFATAAASAVGGDGGGAAAARRPGSGGATPKLAAQYLERLAGPSTPAETAALLAAALAVADARVVVKRHARAPPLGWTAGGGAAMREGTAAGGSAGLPLPSLALPAGVVRYDVYLRRGGAGGGTGRDLKPDGDDRLPDRAV